MRHRRGRAAFGGLAGWRAVALALLAAVAVAIAIPVGISLAAGDHQARHRAGAGQAATRPASPAPSVTTAQPDNPLAPPVSGAYLGAYVQPKTYTSAAEVAAVRSFQKSISGKLNLVHVYHPWDQVFPSPADRTFVRGGKVLLLTWGGTPDTEKIIAGSYDQLIMARAEAVKHLHRPILMEFRHEMDRPNLQWAIHGPANYIKAWDHIRTIFTQAGATNVSWVWCPTGYGFQVGRAQAFYPGNSEVDWVCADVYTVTPHQSLQRAAAPFMKWAAGTGKPIIIGEFADNDAAAKWAAWLTAAGQFVEKHPQIKAIAYFNANGTDSNGKPFKYWLGSNQQALSAFARLVATSYFQPPGPPKL